LYPSGTASPDPSTKARHASNRHRPSKHSDALINALENAARMVGGNMQCFAVRRFDGPRLNMACLAGIGTMWFSERLA
jgi:hypothetical protein